MKNSNLISGVVSFYTIAFTILILVFFIVAYYQFDFIKQSVGSISCKYSRERIQKSYINYNKDHNRRMISEIYRPIKLNILYDKKLLNYVPQCPAGGEYRIDEDDNVYCTIHNIKIEKKY